LKDAVNQAEADDGLKVVIFKAAGDKLGLNSWIRPVVYHTLATNIVYRDEEKNNMFIKDREKSGEKKAFHKLHDSMEEALNKTKYFKSYTGK
jgi:hypothetical protein